MGIHIHRVGTRVMHIGAGGVQVIHPRSAAATDATKATLTVAGTEDAITVHVNASQTALAQMLDLHLDIKKVITTVEDADVMATGTFNIHAATTFRRTT